MFTYCVKQLLGPSQGVAWLAAVSASLLLAKPGQAALPQELDKPYQVEVVLHVAPNRLLTDVFKQQLARELNDLLQQALGGLAQVKVQTDHPILKEIAAQGLLPALGSHKETGSVKTHVLRVDFVDGQFYQIESAQHDGQTGLVSPVVRRARTADRPLVSKLAAELVVRDFGPIGTIVDAKDPDRVKVALKAGQLADAERLVQQGDVFAIAQVSGGGRQVVPEAYLHVVEEPRSKEGIFYGRLLARYADEAKKLQEPAGGAQGYRCQKLAAVQGPLRLRIVDDKGQPQAGLRIEVARPGANPNRENKGLTERDGTVDTKADYDRLALVWVVHNNTARRIPVPILDDRVVVCRVRLDAVGEERVTLGIRKRALNDLVNGLLLTVNQVLRDLNDLTREGKHDEALARASEGIRIIQRSLPDLRRELVALRGEIVRTVPAADRGRLLDDSGFKQLETALENLESFVTAQNELIKEKAKQQELQAEILNLINQARLARDQADYDQAIPLYEKALAKADQPKLRKELAALKSLWEKVGGPNHQKARDFIFGVWAKADSVDQIKELLDEAKKQCAVCQKQGDFLTLNKFLAVYPTHAKRLEQFLVTQRRDTEEGVKRFEMFDGVAEELLKLFQDVSEAVRGPEKK